MNAAVAIAPQKKGMLETMAERFGLDPQIFERTIYATCMPANATREEFVACMMIANKLDLDPIRKEIYFMRTKTGLIQPIVGMDGWISLAQRHPQFRGYTFREVPGADGAVIACECTFYREDWKHPLVVTEYMAECKGNSEPWKKTPIRMLRNRTLTQAVRLGVGIGGVMEPDEFEQWQARDVTPVSARPLAVMDELPDIPDGTDDTASAETGHPQTDAEFLAGFRDTVERHHRDPGMLDLIRSDWREAIAERGLEQQCEDIIASVTGEAPTDEPDEMPDLPWETAETAPEKAATLGDQAATAAIKGLEMRLAKLHNATLIKACWRNFENVYASLGPDAQALAAKARDAALARVKKALQAAE